MFDEISAGKAISLPAIATREGLAVRYVGRLIRLALGASASLSLAPLIGLGLLGYSLVKNRASPRRARGRWPDGGDDPAWRI
jgi:hypothetical protein